MYVTVTTTTIKKYLVLFQYYYNCYIIPTTYKIFFFLGDFIEIAFLRQTFAVYSYAQKKMYQGEGIHFIFYLPKLEY